MESSSVRVDVHQHAIPDVYRRALAEAGVDDSGGRALPQWSVSGAVELMDLLGVGTAILSVSTPGVAFLPEPRAAAALARELNDFTAGLRHDQPDRFGFFATLPMVDVVASTEEAERSLDTLDADGVVLLANTRGVYIGAPEQEPLFRALDQRGAVVFIHPGELPGPEVDGIVPFAADFLLDTVRAVYLLVRNGVIRRHRNIRFVLSHAGGFVPYASHRLAVAIASEAGMSPLEVLEDLRSFYFDTALSSSPAALPTLLSFAHEGHVLFGSDWPFAPTAATQYFASGLDAYPLDQAARAEIDAVSARRLFPRLAGGRPLPPVAPPTLARRVRRDIQRAGARAVFRLVQPS